MINVFGGAMAAFIDLQRYATGKAQWDKYEYVESLYDEPQLMRVTCYLDDGKTALGHKVRVGICATQKEWMGSGIVIYENNDGTIGEIIGIYEALDTGCGIDHNGIGTIESGESIDVWQPSEELIAQWQKSYGDYLYVQRIDRPKG